MRQQRFTPQTPTSKHFGDVKRKASTICCRSMETQGRLRSYGRSRRAVRFPQTPHVKTKVTPTHRGRHGARFFHRRVKEVIWAVRGGFVAGKARTQGFPSPAGIVARRRTPHVKTVGQSHRVSSRACVRAARAHHVKTVVRLLCDFGIFVNP